MASVRRVSREKHAVTITGNRTTTEIDITGELSGDEQRPVANSTLGHDLTRNLRLAMVAEPMGAGRTIWHSLFAALVDEGAPPGFVVTPEFALGTEPQRADLLLTTCSDGSQEPN